MGNDFVTREGSIRLFTVDVKVYSLKAVLKTAYWFTERAFLHLQFCSEDFIEVRLRAKLATADPDEIAGDFLNELIDQRLRDLIAAETEDTRDLIIAHALSKTALVNRRFETSDPFSGSESTRELTDHASGSRTPRGFSAETLLDDASAETLNSKLRASTEKQIQSDQLRR